MHESKKKALIALKKAKTTLERNILAIEEHEYGGDIIIQNMSAIGLIKSGNQKILEAFIDTCDESPMKKKQDIVQIFKLLQK